MAAHPLSPNRATRMARAAVAALFLTNGALFANLVPRYPDIKGGLGLSNSAWGVTVAAFPAGALLAGLGANIAIRRFHSADVAAYGTILYSALLVGISLVWHPVGLAVLFFACGAIDAVVDVAQNAHGLRVQRRYGRSIVSSFHGLWSIGAVIGGVIGSVAAGLGVPLRVHLPLAAVVFSVVALGAKAFTLPGSDASERATSDEIGSSAPKRKNHIPRSALYSLVLLGAIGAFGAMVEDSGQSWSALFLTTERGAGPAMAGAGFVALMTAMTIGRLTGDRVIDRIGQPTTGRLGGALVFAGILVVVFGPGLWLPVVGFALAGLGSATQVPAAMHAADELPYVPPGMGLTVMSWLLRVGFLAAPPIVGRIADAASIGTGLLVVAAGGLMTVILAPALNQGRHR